MNLYLIVPLLAWVVAQGGKYVYAAIKTRSIKVFNKLYVSGGMPSAHSATVVSLAVYIGLEEGLDSALFAIAGVLAMIVMYDAVMVRRSSGEQGLRLNKLSKAVQPELPQLHIAKGHTPVEVVVGALVGATIASVVFFTLK